MVKKKIQNIQKEEKIDYYYNPNVKCTCEAIFADTHRSYCRRRQRPIPKHKGDKS